jgi:hypothetical protein
MASVLGASEPTLLRSIWLNDGSLSPRDLFCYLKARFGAPNGMAMWLRQPSTENLIQWEYTVGVGAEDSYLIISGTNRTTQFVALGRENLSDCDKSAVMAALKADFASRGEQISAVRKCLEQWDLFTNPYTRLDRIIDTLVNRLKALDLTEPKFEKATGTRQELAAFNAARQGWVASVGEARLLGVSLRMLVPVLGESFINLLIFLLAKPEVARDERLMQEHLRQPIDVRVKSLHLYSRGYARPVDTSDPKYKAFHSVMSARNDLLHANVNPLRLKFDQVWFDGTIPLFKEEGSLLQRTVCNSLAGITPDQALSDEDAVRQFIEFMLQHLEAAVAHDVGLAMKHEQLGWRPDVGRVGILFPDAQAEFIPGEGSR